MDVNGSSKNQAPMRAMFFHLAGILWEKLWKQSCTNDMDTTDVMFDIHDTLCFTIISMTYGRFTISTARKEWYVKLQVACWTWWFLMVISCYIKWYLDESPRHAFFSVYQQSHRLWTAIPICWGYQDTQPIPAMEHLMTFAGVTLRLWAFRQCITDQRGNHLGQAPFASFVQEQHVRSWAKGV